MISPTFSWLKLLLPVMLHNEKKHSIPSFCVQKFISIIKSVSHLYDIIKREKKFENDTGYCCEPMYKKGFGFEVRKKINCRSSCFCDIIT